MLCLQQMSEAAAVQHAGELLQAVSAGYGAVQPHDEAAAIAVEEASGRECAPGQNLPLQYRLEM